MAERGNLIHSWLLKGVFLIWGSWILLEYLAWHPYYLQAIVDNPYLGLFLKFAGGALAISAFLEYRRRRLPSGELRFSLRGIYLLALFFLLSLLVLSDYIAGQPKLEGVSTGVRLGYFLGYGLYLLAVLFFLVLAAYGIGKRLLKLFPLRYGDALPIPAIALGFSIIGTILLLIALAGFLFNYVAWVVVGAAFLLGVRENVAFAGRLWVQPHPVKLRQSWPILLVLTVLFIAVIQFIAGIKAFPLGYDGASVYINQASLISDYAALPDFPTAHNWALIMALGQLLFGSETISILLSHSMSILCFFAIWMVARKWLSDRYALLAAAIPFASQHYGFHTMADEKTDLAFLFFGLAAILLVLPAGIYKKKPAWMVRLRMDRLPSAWPAWALSGWIAGYAFGIKYTALFLIASLGIMAFYRSGKERAALGYFLLAGSGFFLLGIYRLAYLLLSPETALALGFSLGIVGLGLLWSAHRQNLRNVLKPLLLTVGLVVLSVLAYSPWALRNLVNSGEVNISAITRQVEAGPDLVYIPDDTEVTSPTEILENREAERPENWNRAGRSPEERQRLRELRAEKPYDPTQYTPAVYEEVIRYLGYEPGLWKYTSVPYDLMTNVNIPGGRYLDLGFLLLLGLPLLLFSPPGVRRSAIRNLASLALLFVWVATCYFAMYGGPEGMQPAAEVLAERQNTFAAQTGGANSSFWSVYKTGLIPLLGIAEVLEPVLVFGSTFSLWLVMTLLLLLYGITYILFRPRLQTMSKGLTALLFFLGLYIFTWWVFGNGVVWYGFLYWTLIPILLVRYLQHTPELLGPGNAIFSRYFLGTVITLFIAGGTMLYLTNPIVGGVRNQVFSWQNVDYATNPNASRSTVLRTFNPFFPEAIEYMNSDLEAKVYSVNTYLGYHVKQNDRRLINDMVLSRFAEIREEMGDGNEFFNILKDNGYRYILYDLGTYAVDQTPEGSLAAKCQDFLNLLANSPQVELLVTDNYVLDEENGDKWVTLPDGRRFKGRGDLVGQVISPGSFVLYAIR